jgi:hypothetical protein
MPLNLTMSVMSAVEFVLWAVLAFLFWTKKLHRRFPAMSAYLALRMGSMPILLILLFGQAQHWFNDYCFVVYFFAYWAVYMASAIMLFFVCMEVFQTALSAFAGLKRFGIVVFRWAALASVVVSFSTLSYSHRGLLIIPDIAYGLMRSVSVVELCLLGFLCFSMNALRLSVRDMSFGISLGFGLMCTNDLLHSMLISVFTSLIAPDQLIYESMILIALGTWGLYFALPEPARLPVVMPVNSTIYRWNEIASALGHTGTQVAVPQPVGSFFLTDVEDVVEKVLNRTLKSSESKP